MTNLLARAAAVVAILSCSFLLSRAQEPTPVPLQLATSTPLPVLGGGPAASATPTPTETPLGPTLVEATSGSVNVRADASTEATILGIIVPGETFPITGRYFRWLQFRFPNSPSGLGWVYDELVTVHGDETLIPDLSQAPPTADPRFTGLTQTANAILNVPGGDLTATANARVLVEPVAVGADTTTLSENSLNPEGAERLPTFTPVPNVDQLVASSNVVPTSTAVPVLIDLTTRTGSFPPILPIAALVGFGMLGLIASLLRR